MAGLRAVRDYAENLDGKRHLSALSDMTGFAPETVERVMSAVSDMPIKQSDWKAENLFLPASGKLSGLVGIMLDNIPEIKNLSDVGAGSPVLQNVISDIIADRVSGKGTEEMARSYFEKEGVVYRDAVTACVNAIYGKIVNSVP